MTYKQLSTIIFDDLEPVSLAWLQAPDRDLEKFAHIIDGDDSLQRELHPVELTLEQVLAEISYGQRVVFGEKPDTVPQGTVPVKAHFSGEYGYESVLD